jgi:hypothetical protein
MAAIGFRQRQAAIWLAEDAILDAVPGAPISTAGLIADLKHRQMDDYSIRAAIWALVGRGALELRREQDDVLLSRPEPRPA